MHIIDCLCRVVPRIVPCLLLATQLHAEPNVQSEPSKSQPATVAKAKPASTNKVDASKKSTAAARRVKPDLRSSSVIVLDADDASVLYSKQSNVVMPVASITKLMTALVVLDANQPMDEIIEITRQDRDTVYGSGSRLTIGSKLTRADLMHLALMSSENRAAHALGRTYPGGLAACVKAMNAKARALGMRTARFADPTGLSERNVSNASDLAKLVLAASASEEVRRYSTDDRYTVQVGRQMLEFRNTNTLVSKPDWDIAVQKTGYTSHAGQCLVMQAVIQERPVVMVLLNSFGKYTRVADARRIRRWMEAGHAVPQLAQTH
jgi:D-alanyl-D-alanine endopeptidase (penicillin-binding protein 7)